MTLDKNNLGGPHVSGDAPPPQPARGGTSQASFCDLFCETNKCCPEDFREKVFWFCLYPQATLLARLIWHLNGAYFRPDVELIEQVRNLTNVAEVRLEFSRFRHYHTSMGLFRRFLKVRISGQRLLSLADRLFAKTG